MRRSIVAVASTKSGGMIYGANHFYNKINQPEEYMIGTAFQNWWIKYALKDSGSDSEELWNGGQLIIGDPCLRS